MSSSAITGPIFTDNKRAPSGTAAAPSFAFNDSTGTGVYLVSAGVLGLSTNGVQRVVVDASGNVGIGTASPAYNLTVSKNGGGGDLAQFVRITDTNTANSVGPLHLTIGATNHFASAPTMVLSGTNGIAFGVGDGSDLAAQRKVIIDASGNLLVGGITSPLASGQAPGFDIANASGASTQIRFRNTGAAAGRFWRIGSDTGGTAYFINDVSTGVYISYGNTGWTGLSDERHKTDLKPIENAAVKVASLRAVTGRYKTDEEGKSRAFLIAQDVEKVLPEAVDTSNEERWGITYTDTIPLLVAAIKEQQEIIDKLEARLAALESK
jgi:hypothetical protein